MAKKKKIQDLFDAIPDEETNKLMLMTLLAEVGITPDEYAEYYLMHQRLSPMVNDIISKEKNNAEEEKDIDDSDVFGLPMFGNPFPFAGMNQNFKTFDLKKPLKNAKDLTLTLKIKMKDVAKPPFWRMVEVPADFSFSQLHDVIQTVCGLTDSHFWMFQPSVYNSYTTIAIPASEAAGVDDTTDDAAKTYLTQVFSEKGDKFEYVYDFGDDWAFEITLQAVTKRNDNVPRLLKCKSDLQPMEDSGGSFAYTDYRQLADEMKTLTPKQFKKRVNDLELLDDPKDLLGNLEEAAIDPKYINQHLAEI